LLREHEHACMPQLPDDDGRGDFDFFIVVLRDSIRMLRTLFYENDIVLYSYAFNRDGCRW
jgi:hypothetical protein